MKNNKQNGITLVALVITIIVLLILAGVAISAIAGSDSLFNKAKESADKYNNAAKEETDTINALINSIDKHVKDTIPPKDFEVSSEKTLKNGFIILAKTEDGEEIIGEKKSGIKEYIYYIKKEIDTEYTTEVTTEESKQFTNLEEDTTYNIYVVAMDNWGNKTSSPVISVKTLKDLAFTREFLQSGSIYGNVTYTTGNANNSDGIRVIGRSSQKVGNNNLELDIRWYKEMDFTNYSKLTFYIKKVVNHGSIMVYIDNDFVFTKVYNAGLSTAWTFYEIDISEYTGTHTLNLIGGYPDNTGSTSSQSEYCDIKLIANN